MFAFRPGDSSLNGSTADTIMDIRTGHDVIDLEGLVGPLSRSSYAETWLSGATFGTALTAAQSLAGAGDKKAVFVAGTTDGWLLWDGDGDATTMEQGIVMKGLGASSFAAFEARDTFGYLDPI